MCQTALVTAGAIHAYAVKTKNNTLAKEMDSPLSDLMAGRDTESAASLPGDLRHRKHEYRQSRPTTA